MPGSTGYHPQSIAVCLWHPFIRSLSLVVDLKMAVCTVPAGLLTPPTAPSVIGAWLRPARSWFLSGTSFWEPGV